MAELGLTEGMMAKRIRSAVDWFFGAVTAASVVAGLPWLMWHAAVRRETVPLLVLLGVLYWVAMAVWGRWLWADERYAANKRIEAADRLIDALKTRIAQDEAHEAEMEKRWARLDAIIAANEAPASVEVKLTEDDFARFLSTEDE